MPSLPPTVSARRLAIVCAAPALLLAVVSAVRAQRLQDPDILSYLEQTIAWYRDVGAVLQSPADSREAAYADGLRQSSTDAVRLAFDFARAQAAAPSVQAAETAVPENRRGRNLAQSAAAAEQRAEQAQLQIEQLNRQLQNASGSARARLVALRDEVTSEANFAKARRDALRTLMSFLNAPDDDRLAAKVADLERSVPEAAAARQKAAGGSPPAAPQAVLPQGFRPEASGIIGLAGEAFSISRKMSRLDHLIGQTETLRKNGESLRQPLRTALRDVIRRGDALTQAPDSSDVAALTARRVEIDALLATFKLLSASSSALSEQSAQINSSRGRIVEWRGLLAQRSNAVLRYLAVRMAMLAATLLLILGMSAIWRRATARYVQEVRRRRQLLVLRRVVVGFAVALFVVLSFVTEFGSLATIAGFSAAGLALAMQSVILSVVAYFFLVGRWGVRTGDRVTIAGVTGEVVDVGLVRLYLMELGGADIALQPTGRIVVFPNSVFFQPAAVFKQLPGFDYVWRSFTVKVSEASDYRAIEQRLLAAVRSIYEEYRETVERQHRNIQSSLDMRTAVPSPESRVKFLDSGLEIVIRYPVEIRRAAEIEDRITREVIQHAGPGATVS